MNLQVSQSGERIGAAVARMLSGSPIAQSLAHMFDPAAKTLDDESRAPAAALAVASPAAVERGSETARGGGETIQQLSDHHPIDFFSTTATS